MIVRYALKCGTCEKAHTVRIGMGHDATQVHRFPCRECGEEIVIRMDLDHSRFAWKVECVENCEPIDEVAGAEIVNVDANFVIPPEQQGVDRTFPRFAYMQEMYEASRRAKPSRATALVPDIDYNFRPYRPADYAAEWKLLRKAWSLARNHHTDLSDKQIVQASAEFYPPDQAIEDLPNWVWRLASLLCGPNYGTLFDNAIAAIDPLRGSLLWKDFAGFYDDEAEARGKRYFDLMKAFFDIYSELSQVYFFVVTDLEVPEDHHTTSTDFDRVKMFYGNCYEQFTHLIEFLALVNNMLICRRYNKFQELTLEQYRKLDRPARFGPFEANKAFMAICTEADNQIRNASYHGSFELGPDQIIRYRPGKGETGQERMISYATYLERSVRLFLQVMTLFRIELAVATSLGVRRPI
jgi:hypothetical protein